MPEFPVESPRILLNATGVVNRVMEWGQDAQGKRFKTETQERDPDTGMLKWGLEVFHQRVNFGEDCTVTLMVEVGAAERPDPVPMTPVVFEGLQVSIYKNKAGGLEERWSAEAIPRPTALRRPRPARRARRARTPRRSRPAARRRRRPERGASWRSDKVWSWRLGGCATPRTAPPPSGGPRAW
jgi:hypothetical protein